MVKKMKGIAAAVMETSPYAAMYEDPRTVFRHQSLMQDYEELLKETETKKRELQIMRQRKLTLLAEVRFLRRRYKYLIHYQSQKSLMKQKVAEQPLKLMTKSRNVGNDRNGGGNDDALRNLPQRFRLNQKGKIQNEKELAFRTALPIFDRNRKHKKEAAFRYSATVPDLNQRERIHSGKEATVRGNFPIFDLNQISREEEELHDAGNAMRLEEPKLSLMGGGIDEQHNDLKLSGCRNIGNGPSRAGKRKISWQDQVALRA